MTTLSTPTCLGMAVNVEPDKLYKLERHYLPLGKIGGFPAWLNPSTIPQKESLKCQICGSVMTFLLQIYCTDSADRLYAFHRVIYMFVCRNGACSKTNNSSNFVVFRCNLPKQNPYYSSTEALNPEIVGDVRDPFFNADIYAKLCVVCGCRASKKCAKCAKQMYCTREHQIIDWNTNHKHECNTNQKDYLLLSSIEKAVLRKKHGFTFPEYGIEIMIAEKQTVDIDDMSDEDNDNNNEENDFDNKNSLIDGSNVQKSMATEHSKLREYEHKLAEHAEFIHEIVGEDKKDEAFKRFYKWIRHEPEQLLCYKRGGEPLLATDYSPIPAKIPNCPLCGASREFEFQIMPHLLTLIDVDAVVQSLDWATLLIYTCKNNCLIPGDGYALEWVFKQDFVLSPSEEITEN